MRTFLTVFIFLFLFIGCSKEENKEENKEKNMTALPFLKDVNVLDTDVVDNTEIFDAIKLYKAGTIVQKNGQLYTVDHEFELLNLAYVPSFGENNLVSSVLFPDAETKIYETIKEFSKLPFDGNTMTCPIPSTPFEDITETPEFYWHYTEVTRDFHEGTYYRYMDDPRHNYYEDRKWVTEGNKYREYAQGRDRADDSILYTTDNLVDKVVDPTNVYGDEYEDGYMKQYSVIRIGNLLYKVNSSSDWTDVPSFADTRYFKEYEYALTEYSLLNQDKPFDDIATTRATRENYLSYRFSPIAGDTYVAIVLSGAVGNLAIINVEGETYKYPLSNIPDGETIIHYIQDVSNPIDDDVLIQVSNTGSVAELGGINLAYDFVDMGITDTGLSFDLNNLGFYEEKKGGYIDVKEGVILQTLNVSVYNEMKDFEALLLNIKKFKRSRMGFDLGDSWKEEHFLSRVLKVVGRMNMPSLKIDSEKGIPREDDAFITTFVIEEAA